MFISKVITSTNYKNYNPDEMIKDFEKVDWDVLYEIKNVNTALTFFNSIVKQNFDSCASYAETNQKKTVSVVKF